MPGRVDGDKGMRGGGGGSNLLAVAYRIGYIKKNIDSWEKSIVKMLTGP